jgi:uncharacterized protein YukE
MTVFEDMANRRIDTDEEIRHLRSELERSQAVVQEVWHCSPFQLYTIEHER